MPSSEPWSRLNDLQSPPRSQRIPHKPGKGVVQMVAGFLKSGSEDTLSVFTGSAEIIGNPKATAVQPICAFGLSGWIGDDEVDAAFERASQRMEQDLRAG